MTTHMTGTREEWLAARLELLEAEKELTRRSDELARRRQALPWVRVDKDIPIRDRRRDRLAGRSFPRALAAPRLPLHVRARLHGGVPVLLGDRGRVRRFRRPPGQPRRHAVGGVARAAREAAGVQAADGLDVSPGRPRSASDFNFDFNVSFTEEQQREGGDRIQLPSAAATRWIATTSPPASPVVRERGHVRDRRGHLYVRDRPGMSAFVLEDGVVYHTYSTYARGLDGLWGMYQWLDRAPQGRNETGIWWRRHDEYGSAEPGRERRMCNRRRDIAADDLPSEPPGRPSSASRHCCSPPARR